jgi:diguanylate cyclase (GGDEF)-like protein
MTRAQRPARPAPAVLQPEEREFARWLAKDAAVVDYFAGAMASVPRELWSTLESLRKRKGRSLYVELLYALTHKYFRSMDARRLWSALVRHREDLNRSLKRTVGLKVAALDFFDGRPEHLRDLQLLPAEDLDNLMISAHQDGLTGLSNHRYFQERLREEIIRSHRYHHTFGLLFLDLDRFKQYNDTHGHPQGDRLLKEIAQRLKTACRQSDVVARYGGDEFAVILPETGTRPCLKVALRLLETLAHPVPVKSEAHDIPVVSVSIGLSLYPCDGLVAERLIDSADKALYRAKHSGRNCLSHGPRILRRPFPKGSRA